MRERDALGEKDLHITLQPQLEERRQNGGYWRGSSKKRRGATASLLTQVQRVKRRDAGSLVNATRDKIVPRALLRKQRRTEGRGPKKIRENDPKFSLGGKRSATYSMRGKLRKPGPYPREPGSASRVGFN